MCSSCLARRKVYREANSEQVGATIKKWNENNKEHIAARGKVWQEANREKRYATKARRRASKLRRTPPWANHDKINKVYALARKIRDWGCDVHVDHIIPLQGQLVSGLHCESNVQILSAYDNISKGNNYELPNVNGKVA